MRLASVLSVVLMAALVVFVVHDRSRLAGQVHGRQVRSVACARAYPGRKHAAARARACGSGQLAQLRLGDLLGLPFFAIALGLSLILIYKIRRPEAAGSGVGRFGDPRPDDPVL